MVKKITWAHIARHLPMFEVHCDPCGRTGRYRTEKPLVRYDDTDIQQFQRDLIQRCPRNTSTIELGSGCAPLVPTLRELPINQEPRRK